MLTVPDELSEKLTTNGAHPLVGVAVKSTVWEKEGLPVTSSNRKRIEEKAGNCSNLFMCKKARERAYSAICVPFTSIWKNKQMIC